MPEIIYYLNDEINIKFRMHFVSYDEMQFYTVIYDNLVRMWFQAAFQTLQKD